MRRIVKFFISSGLLFPFLVIAQGGITPIDPIIGRRVDIFDIILTLIDWLTGLLILLAVVIIVWSAYLYLLGSDDDEKISRAKKLLIYVVVAIGLALLSKGIVYIVTRLVAPTIDPRLN